MSPEERDAAYLWDLLTAGHEVQSFLHGVSYHRFTSDKMMRYAVERLLMAIGEAAKNLSEDFKAEHSDIPWKGMIGLRNIIAHEYGEVLVERIWYAAAEQLPVLIAILEPSLPPEPGA